jgi:Lrp/AsnC family transcriptional regulator for asnA, asnC and gidA
LLALTAVVKQTAMVPDRPHNGAPPLDDTSKAIIAELQQDGRRAYSAIGKSVGLSEAAVRARVQRLVDKGVMDIVAVTDPLQLGFPRQAMVGVRVDTDPEPVAEALSSLTEVSYVVVTAGSFDLLVEVVCRSDDHLLDVVNRQIRAMDAVCGTETFVYLKLAKQTYSWGVS